uniref:Uncharacterized protein n=1 Tax=Ciona savignyi TaxID=51511 RepID=H2Z760_CIOSA
MLEEDDTNFVGTIVEDIVEQTLAECHKRYTWNQVLPFTVFQAKDALLQIVQWRFLNRDLGEANVSKDPGWTEDSEPEAAVIDSWAQGSVPVIVRPQSSSLPSISAISEEPAFLQGQVDNSNLTVSGTEPTTLSEGQTDSSEKSGKHETSQEKSEEKVLEPEFAPEPPRTKKKKRASYKRHVGRLPSPKVSEMVTPLDKDDQELPPATENPTNAHLSPSQKSLLKVQAGRPPGNREVTFDEKGNVVGVMKLNTRTLPTHRGTGSIQHYRSRSRS